MIHLLLLYEDFYIFIHKKMHRILLLFCFILIKNLFLQYNYKNKIKWFIIDILVLFIVLVLFYCLVFFLFSYAYSGIFTQTFLWQIIIYWIFIIILFYPYLKSKIYKKNKDLNYLWLWWDLWLDLFFIILAFRF